jgi:hypothetical protein
MKKLNWNTILAIVGAACELAPDLTGLAAWLTSLHVGWITHVAHGLGILALLMASLPHIIARLRGPLALLGLATPPGAQAPWNPARDAGVISTAQIGTQQFLDTSVSIAGQPSPPTQPIEQRLAPPPRDPDKGAIGTMLLVAGVMLAVFGAWVVIAFSCPSMVRAEGTYKIDDPSAILASDSDDTCEATDGSGDLEPCSWQKARKDAVEAQPESARNARECRAKSCRVHYFSDCIECTTFYRAPNQRMWYCDCEWTLPTSRPTQKKGK